MSKHQKLSIHSALVVALGLALTFSCVERLDFVGETTEGQLIIYGLFTDVDERQVVNVSRTSLSGLAPRGVPNAKVTVVSASGARFPYTSLKNGEYELIGGYRAIKGQSYALEVVLDGKVYLSNYEKVPELAAEDVLSFSFEVEPFRTDVPENVFKIFSKTTLPDTQDPIYLRWTIEETYLWPLAWLRGTGIPPPQPPPCFISDVIEPTKINLVDGSGTSTRKSTLLLGRRLVDNSFQYPFFVSVRQLSITREAYAYWEKIKIIISNQGSLFDIPPAPVLGNIVNVSNKEEMVLGYFEVAKTKITRIYTTNANVPFYLLDPCQFIPSTPDEAYPSECRSCEARAQGRSWTTKAPDWWKYD
ncbi:MAG: DUF4249 domain-containing protein [Algoriphagus sp.]|nr:DUF4249 domain-containing protein [Algoriphagus sp.]